MDNPTTIHRISDPMRTFLGPRTSVGLAMAKQIRDGVDLPPLDDDADRPTREMLESILSRSEGEKAVSIRTDLQETMMKNVSVFRNEETLAEAMSDLAQLRQRAKNVIVGDKGKQFNTDLMDAVEIGFMVDYAQAIAAGARNRTESRGAHSREDFTSRDDDAWLKHTLYWADAEGEFEIGHKNVIITRFQPKERKY